MRSARRASGQSICCSSRRRATSPSAAPCSRRLRRRFAADRARMNYFVRVFRNLARNKGRTILTTLSITVSVFIFASLISLPSLIDQVLRDRASSLRLITHSKATLFYLLPEAYRRQIEKIPHVEAVAGFGPFLGTRRGAHLEHAAASVLHHPPITLFPHYGTLPRPTPPDATTTH